MPKNIADLTEKLIAFRKERDWEQFHKPKDLAVSLSLEATEAVENGRNHVNLTCF